MRTARACLSLWMRNKGGVRSLALAGFASERTFHLTAVLTPRLGSEHSMCRTISIVYDCTHKSYGSLSRCRGTIPVRRSQPRNTRLRAACTSAATLTFYSPQICGPCHHDKFSSEWNAKLVRATNAVGICAPFDAWDEQDLGSPCWSSQEINLDAEGKTSEPGTDGNQNEHTEIARDNIDLHRELEELRDEHNRSLWYMMTQYPSCNRTSLPKKRYCRHKVNGRSPLRFEVRLGG